MSKKTYIVESYDPATRKIERVTVTHEVYNAYRRSGWNIADNNQSFFKHEIQMSSLIGGEDGGYDNFRFSRNVCSELGCRYPPPFIMIRSAREPSEFNEK